MTYSIEEALKEQIRYCYELPSYRCGIYISRIDKKNFIVNMLKEILINDDSIKKIINNQYDFVVHFHCNSSLKIICANENARGYKNNGVIIDNDIEDEVVNCVIKPTIIPRWFEECKRESWEEVEKRIFYCDL